MSQLDTTAVNLKVTQVKQGPSSRFILAVHCFGSNEATSEPFVIDNLAQVRFKAKVANKNEHFIYISAMKHALAKDDEVRINVKFNMCTSNPLNLIMLCKDSWHDCSKVIKQNDCTVIRSPGDHYSQHTYVFSSQTDIEIVALKMTRPAFPKLYEDSDFTDFTLSTQGGKVDIHKACLAAHSSVFKTMFTGSWKETTENLVEIKGYTLETVQQLKDFLYLGTLPADGLRPLITLAALYSITDLKDACAKRLALTVTPEDLYSLHELACANNIPELTWAIAQVTPAEVVNKAHEIKNKQNDNLVQNKDEN